MAKKQKILLVEDDKIFGESLEKILTAEGFECFLAPKPQTALGLCKLHSFDIAIIDCMLPQMNGVDLALQIKQISGPNLSLYMMSGIYKDRNFSVTALKKTGAKSFLIKPFEVQELIQQLKDVVAEKSPDVKMTEDPLKNLTLMEDVTQQVVLQALSEKKTIVGFELPHLLAVSLTFKVSGRILVKNQSSSCTIFLDSEGMHVMPPLIPVTQLKQMISSRGYMAAEDLVRLRDQLDLTSACELNLMSPHFAEQIQKECAVDLLNSLITEETYQMVFNRDPAPPQALTLEQREVDECLQNWIGDTLSLSWLKNYYLQYQNHTLKKSSTTQKKLLSYPIISAHPQILPLFSEPLSLMEIISQANIPEENLYRLLHMLMVHREFYISVKKTVASNNKAHVERLKSLLTTFETQDDFQKLGLTHQAQEADIKKAYQEFSSTLHPDKLADAPPEVRDLSSKVYEHIQIAYNNLKTPEKRQKYLQDLSVKKEGQKVEAIRHADQILLLLLRGDLSAAEGIINDAVALAPDLPRLKILKTWWGLKTRKLPVSQTTKLMQTLPSDDRETAVYHYVKGLQNQASGDVEKAIISFNNALAKDPNFLPARRDLSSLTVNSKKASTNIFTADIKDVVGLFFKKK